MYNDVKVKECQLEATTAKKLAPILYIMKFRIGIKMLQQYFVNLLTNFLFDTDFWCNKMAEKDRETRKPWDVDKLRNVTTFC